RPLPPAPPAALAGAPLPPSRCRASGCTCTSTCSASSTARRRSRCSAPGCCDRFPPPFRNSCSRCCSPGPRLTACERPPHDLLREGPRNVSRELWTAVDGYVAERLIGSDPALDAALHTSAEAGLPAIAVSPSQGKLLHLLVRALGARTVL